MFSRRTIADRKDSIKMKWMLVYLFLSLAVEPTAFADNVKPGDSDFPALNISAHINETVSGHIPEKWELRLGATYYPKEGGILNPVTGGLVCGWLVGIGASRPYFVDYELPVVRKGDAFTASIPVDRYQEGRCGWHLSAVGYTVVKKHGDPMTAGQLAAAPIDAVQTYPPIDPSDRRSQVDLWCWDSPLEKKYWFNGVQMDCGLAGSAGVSPMKFIPATRRGDNRAVYLYPDMKSLTFIFHDLDAEAAIEKEKR
jgi:hypothetical protein